MDKGRVIVSSTWTCARHLTLSRMASLSLNWRGMDLMDGPTLPFTWNCCFCGPRGSTGAALEYIGTKCLIVDVIRFQPGETLTEILGTPATSEQEAEHQRVMQKQAIRDAKTPDKMKKSVSVKEDGNLNLQGKKDKMKTGLKKLTELGTVNAKNKYQELINDIAKDI
ncbi:ras GTPase-activating-like protein IQGAP1 isoform 2-T2 [Amazona ochrocephala]